MTLANPTTAQTDAATDNGHEFDHVEGGALVYEVETEYRSTVGREVTVARRLVGFAGVEDWDAIHSELARRGHDVGAIHHLEEI